MFGYDSLSKFKGYHSCFEKDGFLCFNYNLGSYSLNDKKVCSFFTIKINEKNFEENSVDYLFTSVEEDETLEDLINFNSYLSLQVPNWFQSALKYIFSILKTKNTTRLKFLLNKKKTIEELIEDMNFTDESQFTLDILRSEEKVVCNKRGFYHDLQQAFDFEGIFYNTRYDEVDGYYYFDLITERDLLKRA